MTLYNDDCFNVFPKIEDKSIDLFVLDLPYANKKFGNCTACKWDTPIDLERMWEEIKRIMKPNATIVHFCNTKFGFALIESNPKWFRYDLIWKKSRKVGFLSANKQPLRQHENIYIFGNDNNDDVDLVRNKELREYAKKVYKYIGISKKLLLNEIGQGIDHFFRYSSSQFGLPIEENYNKLIEKYDIDKMEGFKTYEEMKNLQEKKKKELTTYNPQKTEGKPYKNGADNNPNNVYGITKEKGTITKTDRHPTSIIDIEADHENVYIFKDKQGTYNPQKTEGKPYKDDVRKKNKNCGVYGKEIIPKPTLNKGDRHPTSIIDIENTILEYKNPHKTIHRTQKPVDLLEWLIKTYSNENDTVMDFCMGSGTCGVACKNSNRKFIGVEKEEEMFKKAKKRINEQ
mgnify:CR=1 FL=1